ncbi:hypothetical protein GRI89_17045 [Altererythrobacter salegens]|uniref:Transferrin-binding protein B C-lobe/N-lobe beta-barrel domain-containing protein n=1 Tax=Croceibacterium salegens TaxID=1737568 RepID=A0A6I4SYV4_9SPHN|nr:transferrin-binding protein-like solute binding protein [Croceibacterium salegens]MXO61254.1 hypothetical protein [Croceibacterium salegens]
MDNLKANQTFASDAGANDLSFDLTSKTVASGSKSLGDLTISYDATDKSYTVTLGGTSDKFLPANVSGTTSNDTQYSIAVSGGHDYLTIVSKPYSGLPATQYVRMAYLQRNTISGSVQDTLFSTFTFGLDSAASAVPRVGTAGYQIDVFGLASSPGHEPRIFQGSGLFSTDFASGIFTAQTTTMTDYNLLTGEGTYGGGIDMFASGHLSASDSTFAGYAVFGGRYGQIPGTLSGSFYGPQAQEIGASFSGTSTTGAAVTGSFTGTSVPGAAMPNLTMTNLVRDQLFTAPSAQFSVTRKAGAITYVQTLLGSGQITWHSDGSFLFAPLSSQFPHGQIDGTDIVTSSNPNFTSYEATLKDASGGPQDVSLQLYKPGSANTELALTYTSFGHLTVSQVPSHTDEDFFVYGLETQQFLMQARTGSAQYHGVVYGAGANQPTSDEYDVSGTSSFDVNFSTQVMSGTLDLTGTGRNGSLSIDFGTYDFSGALSGDFIDTTVDLTKGGTGAGSLTTRFYGPAGEEIGGNFSINVPAGNPGAGTQISGITVAKQQ